MITTRPELERRLRGLTRGFEFRWGEPVSCRERKLEFVLDLRCEQGVFAGYTGTVRCSGVLPGLASGLRWVVRPVGSENIVAQGQTNCLGIFALKGLPDGNYALEIGVPAES